MLLWNAFSYIGRDFTATAVDGEVIRFSLHGDDSGRQRVEMSPLCIPVGEGNLQVIFSRAGQIVLDPHNEKPQRPVGHCFEDHFPNTQRWDRGENPEVVELIAEASRASFSWSEIYSDDGSRYYRGTLDPTMRKQMSIRTGRTMIGLLVPYVLFARQGASVVRADYDVQWRIVTNSGDDSKYSPVGTTQFAFGGLHLFGLS